MSNYNYKYIPASMSIRPKNDSSPKNAYTELFEETLNDQFYNSSNWFTIQEETSIGSQVFENVDVRIAHVINAETGLKLGDDWKTLYFKPRHTVELGRYYFFEDNYWLVINTELTKNLTQTCTIRRCNNTLRWIDEATGAYYSEPCTIEPLVKEPRDYFTQGSPFTTPGGFLHINSQFNTRTNLINENQRFMFGNEGHWTAYKVIGTGLNDFRNEQTLDNNSAKIITIDLIANFVNDDLDDVVNGVADAYTNLYTVSLNHSSAQGAPSSTIQLQESILYNGVSVTRNMEWSTSNANVATVSASGLVTLITNGSCIITANILNSSASAACTILVSASPAVNNDIVISPDSNYILEGLQKSYSVYLYRNDVIQADAFTITCNGSNVPVANYTFAQTDGNHFSITNNLRDDSSHLIITCTSGSNVSTRNIYLKGVY